MTAPTNIDLYDPQLDETDEDDDDDELYYFYDDIDNYHQLRYERGDMPDDDHNDLIDHLKLVLLWLFYGMAVTVQREFNFYETNNRMEKPLYPDLYVLKRLKEPGSSYRIGEDGPPPNLILEVMSKNTRTKDIGTKPKDKPQRYAKWGVQEYFVYDPRRRVRRKNAQRLWGWRLYSDGRYQSIEAEPDGRMWSDELDSWLVPNGKMLQLYDRASNLRLTKEEYEEREKMIAQQQVQLERAAGETERKARQTEQKAKEAERAAKEAAQQRADKLAEKLRQLGIDPDTIK